MNTYEKNLAKLKDISCLDNGWDNANAIKINGAIIEKLKLILKDLRVQPDIFPLVNGNIQFEYEKEDGRYLEFETLNTDKIKVFSIGKLGETTTKEIDFVLEYIAKDLEDFYR